MKKLFLLILFPLLLGTDYYASPTGSGTTCSNAVPCSVEYAVDTKSTGGDIIYLKDGTYNCGSDSNDCIRASTSGSAGNFKTIRAVNDGEVTIDGGAVRGVGGNRPCYFYDVDYWNLGDSAISGVSDGGFICRGGDDGSILVSGGSTNINIRRMSAVDGGVGLGIWYDSQNILVEDSIGYGYGRKNIYQFSTNAGPVIFRRNWARWTDFDIVTSTQPRECYDAYISSLSNYENNICTVDYTVNASRAVKAKSYIASAKAGQDITSDNFYGNIGLYTGGYDFALHSTQQPERDCDTIVYKHNVSIGSDTDSASTQDGMLTLCADDTIYANNTIVDFQDKGFYIGAKDGFPDTDAILRNNVFLSGETAYDEQDSQTADNDYNVYYGNTSNGDRDGANDITGTDPSYDTDTYGAGAYLMRPTGGSLESSGAGGAYESFMGAEILYRYTSTFGSRTPTLTATELWPWPMENRIQDETLAYYGNCYSATYETVQKHDNAGVNCTGGIWKTLEGAYGEAAEPTVVTISQPDGVGDSVEVGDSYSVTYTLIDPDSVEVCDFYYSATQVTTGGTAIPGCQDAPEGTDVTCTWNTVGVTPGDYYVYCQVEGESEAEVSTGTLTITPVGTSRGGINATTNASFN